MNKHLLSCSALAATLLTGCQSLSSAKETTPEPKTAAIAGEAVLYARDGSVVTPGATQNLPRRDVQGGEGSRGKILELYQRVVEERDQLQLSLAERDSELVRARKQLEAESTRAQDLEARLHTAEQSAAALTSQNLDLAARLTMAQIRRLEAEKQWLELSISLPSKTVAASLNGVTPASGAKTEPATVKHPPAAKSSARPAQGGDAKTPEQPR